MMDQATADSLSREIEELEEALARHRTRGDGLMAGIAEAELSRVRQMLRPRQSPETVSAQLAALEREREGYLRRGLDDRAAQVDAEIRRRRRRG